MLHRRAGAREQDERAQRRVALRCRQQGEGDAGQHGAAGQQRALAHPFGQHARRQLQERHGGGIGHAQGADLDVAEPERLRPDRQQHVERIGDAVVHEVRGAGGRERAPPVRRALGGGRLAWLFADAHWVPRPPSCSGYSRQCIAMSRRPMVPQRRFRCKRHQPRGALDMIVITRNGKTTVITGWRAWLIGVVVFVATTILLALFAFLALGIRPHAHHGGLHRRAGGHRRRADRLPVPAAGVSKARGLAVVRPLPGRSSRRSQRFGAAQ